MVRSQREAFRLELHPVRAVRLRLLPVDLVREDSVLGRLNPPHLRLLRLQLRHQ
jgi:hypothetical protein